jgi:hypothetical protein
MTDIVELKSNGVVVYPKTHVSAVEGITTIKGEQGEPGPAGPEGPAGVNATTTAPATSTTAGLMSAADKTKLDTLPTITFNKVGSV